MNDLSENLTSNAKYFADDTSLFSVVHDVSISAKDLNDDLEKLMTGLSNGKLVSTKIQANKPRKLFQSQIKKISPPNLSFEQ